jgi:methionyl-tRNA synthetase
VQYQLLGAQIGNLYARVSSPKILSKIGQLSAEHRDQEFEAHLSGMVNKFDEQMEANGISKACEGIMEVIAEVSDEPLAYSVSSGLHLMCPA